MASARPQARAGWQPKYQHFGACYQDVLDAPPSKVAEVVDGRLYLHPQPAGPHNSAGTYLVAHLTGPFDLLKAGLTGWWIRYEPELHFGKPPRKDILVPDLAGWRRERMPEAPSKAFVTLAPDWVCEILSPSTRRMDLTRKRDLYAREGVPYLWFVDPEARTLEAFALHGGQWTQIASLSDEEPVSVPPFDAISFPLATLWPHAKKEAA